MDKTLSKGIQVSLFIVLTVLILYFGKEVLAPIAIASILSMLFVVPSTRLEHKGLPRWASALLSVVILAACLAGLVFLLNWQLQSFAEQLDDMKKNLSQMLSNLQGWIRERSGIAPSEQKAIAEEQIKNGSGNGGMAQQVIAGFFSLSIDVILVFVYTYLFLFYRARLKNFLLKITDLNRRERTLEIVDSASQVAASYMTGLAKMIVTLWILYGIGFTAIGVENALFFAIVCGLLELIPFIGNLTGTAITILGVTAQGGETDMILGVLAIYIVVQFIQTYLLEPLVVGNEVNINPLFTICSLVLAEAVWGIPGLILAIPIAGILKIICDRVPYLQPYGYLIGSDKKPKKPFWKRKAN